MPTSSQVPNAELDKDTKRQVIAGLKLVLSRLQNAGVLDPALTYQNVLASPETLDSFFRQFVAHRSECQDIVVAGDGTPVLTDDQPLSCGVTLDQIAQLLLRTCARRVFEVDQIQAARSRKPKEAVGFIDKIAGIFKANDDRGRKAADEDEIGGFEPGLERKFRALTPYLIYPWQVMLLRPLRKHLSLSQINLLQGDMLNLTTPETIAIVGSMDIGTLRDARTILGSDFGVVLSSYPQSIKGMMMWSPEMILYFRELLGNSVWEFFTRDDMFFNAAISLEHPIVAQLGKILSYIKLENLQEVTRLNADRLEILITALHNTLGEDVMRMALENPDFAKRDLRKIVDSILHSKQDKEQLLASITTTCQATANDTREWLAKSAMTEK